jgi:hypothetical protein
LEPLSLTELALVTKFLAVQVLVSSLRVKRRIG